MSRTYNTIILGAVLGLAVGTIAVAALFFGRGLFTISGVGGSMPTPITVVLDSPTPTSELPTAAPTATETPAATDGSVTAVPTTGGGQVVVTSPAATPIAVSNSAVQYIMALSDVNIRSGPGTGYAIVGWIAEGQIAKVTGANEPTGWWRVICPDDTVGSCWVTGNAQFTRPTSAPGPVVTAAPVTPVPATPAACTDSAALVADVTVPDNSQFAPITGFNKTWRIKNTGTCTWTNNYQIVHAGGSLMGAVASAFPLNQTVAPGSTADVTISMVSPAAAGSHKSDWKLQNSLGRTFGIGSSNNPFFVKIVVTSPNPATIAGKVFMDFNENGIYDGSDILVGNREVWLIPGTACHVSRNQVAAVAYSGADGVYTFKGDYNGNYCVGLVGVDGLEDARAASVAPGQVVTTINLRAFAPLGSISGFVWNDFCRVSDGSGNTMEGNCVANGTGSSQADGMVQPTEVNIPGITVLLQSGNCFNNNSVPVSAVTDGNGRYTFETLPDGIYCVSINALAAGNQEKLLPGAWTFPQNDVWYQELNIINGANAYSVNFGWDYQFN